LGTDCLVIQENLEEILATPSTDDNRKLWCRRTTAVSASDNITHIFVGNISPLSVIVFTLTVHFLVGSVWPVILLFIGCLTISRLCRWINSHILSKMWLYNVFLLSHRQRRSNCQWVWRDRTCLDIYAYCLLNKATSVPSNMPAILLEQTNTTSVAIILDVSRNLIEKHLRKRIHAPTSSRSFAFATRLILFFDFSIQASITALTLLERWYQKMNVPLIKISQLNDKLDHDATTGDIQWSKRSISVLFEAIQQAMEQRAPRSPTIDDSLMPWQLAQNSRLFHE
jgi:hypothetical protein